MVKRAVLVYQVGLANVFMVDPVVGADRIVGRRRMLQADYRSCELYAKGLRDAGSELEVAHCDEAGDVTRADWQPGAGDLWREKKYPPAQCLFEERERALAGGRDQ